MKRGNSN